LPINSVISFAIFIIDSYPDRLASVSLRSGLA
jgi:hypothetical protein